MNAGPMTMSSAESLYKTGTDVWLCSENLKFLLGGLVGQEETFRE